MSDRNLERFEPSKPLLSNEGEEFPGQQAAGSSEEPEAQLKDLSPVESAVSDEQLREKGMFPKTYWDFLSNPTN